MTATRHSSKHDHQPPPEPKQKPEEVLSGIKLTAIGQGGDGDVVDEVYDDEDDKDQVQDGKTIFTTYAELVTPMNVTNGTIQITNTHLLFTDEVNDGAKSKV